MGNERILVVDDDRDIVATLKIQLEKDLHIKKHSKQINPTKRLINFDFPPAK